MAAVENPPTVTKLVGSLIDDIGMGPYQMKEAVLSSCTRLADGAELLVIGSVTHAVAKEWDLTVTQKSGVVSIVFVGVLIGTLISGPCSDGFGRRWPTIISYATVAIFSIVSAFTVGFYTLSVTRFFVGVAVGFGQAPTLTYCLEIAPAAWRTFVYCFPMYFFIAGEAYCACIIMLDDPSMKHLRWRLLVIMGALPAVVFTFVGAAFLNESPSWLASRGKEEEAKEVLAKMNRMNASHPARLEFIALQEESDKSDNADMKTVLRVIFGPAMLYSTLVSCFTCFSLNSVYYGGLYVFPQVLSENVKTGSSPAFALLMGALCEVPGYILALGFDRVMDRRPTLVVALFMLTTCVLAFVHGGIHQFESGSAQLMVHYGYAGYKLVTSVIFLMAYQYSAEIYPVSCRASGSSLSMGFGKIGAITAPLVFEWTMEFFGTWTVFFYIMACILFLNAMLVTFLPYETRGKALRESSDESHETDPLCPCLERSKQT